MLESEEQHTATFESAEGTEAVVFVRIRMLGSNSA